VDRHALAGGAGFEDGLHPTSQLPWGRRREILDREVHLGQPVKPEFGGFVRAVVEVDQDPHATPAQPRQGAFRAGVGAAHHAVVDPHTAVEERG
jgi:hypothetical protein